MLSKEKEPYLSIVVASRNDNHGGDMLKRMRIFVKALIHQCNKVQLNCELVFVEWNPIPGQPRLNEILPAVKQEDYLNIRYILVPPEIHEKLNFSKQIPLFQMIAKNVGIRRAKAKFVLCTNVDLIFSDDLFATLAKKELKENCFYRANRCDVPNTLEESWTVEQQLEFCKVNIKARLGKNPLYANFYDTTGFMFKYRIFTPLLSLLSKIKSTYSKKVSDRLLELDLDACGDFTLMSKKNWIDIQGYPELEIYSIHIDSMGILAAAALNIKQVIFKGDECSYHMEHTGGWEFKNPIDKIHFYTKKPMLDWWTVREAGAYLMENKKKFDLNKSDWGLANETLREIAGSLEYSIK
jgi:hypothetical protein